MRRGNYCLYKGREYSFSQVSDNEINIVSNQIDDLKNGFIEKKYSDKIKKQFNLPTVLTKTIGVAEVDELYEISPIAIYKEEKFPIKYIDDIYCCIGTSNYDIAEKYGFDRTDKYFYEKKVLKSEVKTGEEYRLIYKRKDENLEK